MIARARPGFTLIEMVMAVVLTMVVFAITIPFMRVQTRAMGQSAGRLDAEQIARYAQRRIDLDLRLATADPGQPLLVMAGPKAMAFNADIVAEDTTDASALQLSTGADASLVDAWALADATTLSGGTVTYPVANYTDANGAGSRNETITYYLTADTVAGRSDIYVLMRQVNARTPVEIVRGVYIPADSAFFSYFTASSTGALSRIASAALPLYWTSTRTDSIRAVGLRSAGIYLDRRTNTNVIRTVHWTTVLPNAAARIPRACGAAPSDAGRPSLSHTKSTSSSGTVNKWHVSVNFNGSGDDNGGSRDVEYYVLRRRPTSGSTWSYVATIPATRSNSYQYDHFFPFTSGSWTYGVTAYDCAGNASGEQIRAVTITIP